MKPRNLLAIAILILGALASFYCYTRLGELLPMSDPASVTQTEARITEVTTPMVKKNQTPSEVTSEVHFAFTVAGKAVQGGYLVRGEALPEKGAGVPIAYLSTRPEVFLRAKDYADLPRQLTALRWMMFAFALVAMVLPFAVMKHR